MALVGAKVSGRFIVFEGIDGSGKGEQVKRAVLYLKGKLGEDQVVQTKDPGGTPLGDAIRDIMYGDTIGIKALSTGVVDLLFLASHLQNYQTVVTPALTAGKVVVSDRWWYSQGAYSTRRPIQQPIRRAYTECRGMRADLLIFLHGDPTTMVERARMRLEEDHQRKKPWDDSMIQKEIQDAYFRLYSQELEWRPVCVNHKSIGEVWGEVRAILDGGLAEQLNSRWVPWPVGERKP